MQKGLMNRCDIVVVAVTCFVVAFASSVITADLIGVEKEFGVSEEVALVSISVFVVGFGVGKLQFLLPHNEPLLTPLLPT
jgi:hypothetical protein